MSQERRYICCCCNRELPQCNVCGHLLHESEMALPHVNPPLCRRCVGLYFYVRPANQQVRNA